MIQNQYVTEYIKLWKTGKIELNKERIMLIAYLEKHILTRDDLYFDETMLENFIKFAERWYFPLEPFQKFFSAFVFLLYKEDDANFYEQFLLLMGRGAGKMVSSPPWRTSLSFRCMASRNITCRLWPTTRNRPRHLLRKSMTL